MTSFQILTKEYLRSLSPLAQKIGEDVDAAQDAYQDLWNTLEYKEQQQVLDEAIIDPAAVLKYAAYAEHGSICSFDLFFHVSKTIFMHFSINLAKVIWLHSLMPYEIHVIATGYSKMYDGTMRANCTCTLIKGKQNIIVDTMTPWDKQQIIDGLAAHKIACNDINFVVCTHGHSDHIGNNNLFLKAKHIVGFGISFHDEYYIHPFESGEPFHIDEDIKVIPTPGHTLSDVTVLVKTKSNGTVAITGDLFEREEDLTNPKLWKEIAGSENPNKQEENRNKIIALANYIIPGHGPMFHVTQDMKEKSAIALKK